MAATTTTTTDDDFSTVLHEAFRQATRMAYVWPYAQKVLVERPPMTDRPSIHAALQLLDRAAQSTHYGDRWRAAICTTPTGLFSWVPAQLRKTREAAAIMFIELAVRMPLAADDLLALPAALAALHQDTGALGGPIPRPAMRLCVRLQEAAAVLLADWFRPALRQIELANQAYAQRPPPRLVPATSTRA